MAQCGGYAERLCPYAICPGHAGRGHSTHGWHAAQKGVLAHSAYARARQLGGGLVDALVCRDAIRGSEARCAHLGGERLVRGITATQRRGSGSVRAGAAGRSLGEMMALCGRGHGDRGGIHRLCWL
jgi:hypothetical protein